MLSNNDILLTGKLSISQERINEVAEQFYRDVAQIIEENEGALADLNQKIVNQSLKDLSKQLDEGKKLGNV